MKFINNNFNSNLTLLNFAPPSDTDVYSVGMMRTMSSIDAVGGVYNFNIEIVFKNLDPAMACSSMNDMLLYLDKLTNKDVGDRKEYQLILVNALTSVPNYMGQTETHEYVFSTEFNVLMTDI